MLPMATLQSPRQRQASQRRTSSRCVLARDADVGFGRVGKPPAPRGTSSRTLPLEAPPCRRYCR